MTLFALKCYKNVVYRKANIHIKRNQMIKVIWATFLRDILKIATLIHGKYKYMDVKNSLVERLLLLT